MRPRRGLTRKGSGSGWEEGRAEAAEAEGGMRARALGADLREQWERARER